MKIYQSYWPQYKEPAPVYEDVVYHPTQLNFNNNDMQLNMTNTNGSTQKQ